jgi:hypothetical protein
VERLTSHTDNNEGRSPVAHDGAVEGVLCWGVKVTFLQYLARTPGTRVSVGGGAGYLETDEFAFPAARYVDADPELRRGIVQFEGDILVVGHGGLMSVGLAEPWIELNGSRATLSFAHLGPPAGTPARFAMAELEWNVAEGGGDSSGWRTAAARLLPTGGPVFNDVYAPGEPMAPVRVRVDSAPRG